MCLKRCSVKQQRIWLFSVGSILVIIGIVLVTAWPTLSEQLVNSILPLRPHSIMFSKWVVTPVPLYIQFYMYNWTNSHMANNNSVKPNFEECGPYTFREIKVKGDLVWNNNKNLVTYHGLRTFYFEDSKSNGSLHDMITAPHLPTVAAAKIFRKTHPIIRKVVNFGLNREGGKLAMTNTVIDWIFHGIYDDILDFGKKLHSPFLNVNVNHLAYMYMRNNSKELEGTFTIHTGKGNLSQMGDVKYWNGSDHTNYWSGECGRVNGTNGELWSPARKWHDSLTMFYADGARYLNLYPQSNETYRGIEVWRYTSTELTFDSGNIAKETKCFCVKGRECPKNGVIDFSPVSLRAPIYISHSHFYMTDPLYRENTTGLNPDPDKHRISLLVEPTIGIPLNIDAQALLSIFVERDDKIDILKNLSWNFYAPLVSYGIKIELTDDIINLAKSKTTRAQRYRAKIKLNKARNDEYKRKKKERYNRGIFEFNRAFAT